MTISNFPCRICGQKAHGNHFGVYSCRACAAFFRRSATSKWMHKKCQRGGVNGNKCFCKPCRLKRCMDVGMKTEKFQYNRDSILFPDDPITTITPSLSLFVGRPEFLLFCEDPTYRTHSTFNPKILIDVNNLILEASKILDQGCHLPIQAETQLKKLNFGYNLLKFDSENVKQLENFGQAEFLDIIEYYFMKVLKWMMHFDEFRKMEKDIQMKLIQTTWHVWSKIHKCVTTVQFRKSQINPKPTQKVLRNMLMDREKGSLDTSWMSDYPQEYVTRYMLSQNYYDFDIMLAIEKLDPSDIELTYMFAQLCFEYAGKRFQGEIQKVTDHFQQILSNDLHEYYVKEQRRQRYVHRLNELMKVNNLVQRSIWETRPNRELGRVFNVLKIGFSHPEMFMDSGFY
ncbi:unnamed protein product [Caenorhabditis brenneri]